MTRWPFPGDSALDRAKRIAQSYRAELLAADPAACELMDKRADEVGEGWVKPRLVNLDVDEWVTVEDAAELVDRDRSAIHRWIDRGKLNVIKDAKGRRTVRVGQVLDVSADIRRRRAEKRSA